MHLRTAVEIAFAVAAVGAGVAIVTAVIGRGSRRHFVATGIAISAIAVALWAAFAFEMTGSAAVSAAGATLAAVATLAAARIPTLAAKARAVDELLTTAEGRLRTLIEREAADRTAELTRTLARARAESASLLDQQERAAAEERRRAAGERERAASATLATALADTQRQVDARLRAWNDDLDRMRQGVHEQLNALAQRQKQLISDAEMRIASDAERLEAESEQQRAGLVRLRDELARAIQETVTTGTGELDAYAAERRRAMHELDERLRKRERALAEQIEREEAEASRRLQAAFADVERRQVEQLERILTRATSGYADLAGQQFSDAIRGAREDAARRLSRELDRAVQSFMRESERVLAEQLAHVGQAGAKRLDRRLTQVTDGLERQQGEALASFEQRVSAAEHELRRRLESIVADTEAERAVLEARLQELARRIDDAMTRA